MQDSKLSLRYARTRSGVYVRHLRKFAPGDLVYVLQRPRNRLETRAGRKVLMVEAPTTNGRFVLMGPDGTIITESSRNLARCHMPNIDTRLQTINLRARRENTRCEVCKLGDDADRMLLCDRCNRAFHLACMNLSDTVLEGTWFCPICHIQDAQNRLPAPEFNALGPQR